MGTLKVTWCIIVLLFGLLLATSGCGQILGMRQMDLWGAKFQFTEGLDFGVGMNSVDRVENKRGIMPISKEDKL